MSKTLNLVDHLLGRSRRFQHVGRSYDAACVLKQLSRFRKLPPHVTAETQSRLAEHYLDVGRFRKARRRLTAALTREPNNPRLHYLLACAHANADDGDSQRAADHFRRSLELDPNQPDCQSDFGKLLLQIGEPREGLSCLRRAVELAPHDPDMLKSLAGALEEEGKTDESRRALQIALFRNPRDSRFRQMWDHHRFQVLMHEQRRKRRSNTDHDGSTPALLPFARPPLKIVRHDGPTTQPAPHGKRGADVSWRQAK